MSQVELLTPDPGPLVKEDQPSLRASHTPNFPGLLRQLGASLLVTTYQAGKLVMVRNDGDHLNTHYRAFQAPMGLSLAAGGAKFAIGTTLQVWTFRDVPDVARLYPKRCQSYRSHRPGPAYSVRRRMKKGLGTTERALLMSVEP
jgi:hypothetical protein